PGKGYALSAASFLPSLSLGRSVKRLFPRSDLTTRAARRGGFRLLRRLVRLLLSLGHACAQRCHQIDDRSRLLLDRLRRGDLLAGQLGLEERLQVAAVVADELVLVEVGREAADHLAGEL